MLVLLGLLIAWGVNPQRRHFYDHWFTNAGGTVAAGNFDRFLKRKRLAFILSNLHFTSNDDELSGTDRAWYSGAKRNTYRSWNVPESVQSVDHSTGPAAVMRNLEAVLPPPSDGVYYLIDTDRFYTSVQLAYQLLQWRVYSVGTIQGGRQGYCDALVIKRNRPQRFSHGAARMAIAKNFPLMTSLV
ncbi:Hypothetical protein PHPALM_8695 [Phytophthora palmivora]|uniref:PiggyBac transposable element-derived protein domain-containing protein n=1 Tax=Phytophthora palmivora TaxID=4796 RepID=A0A2P4Y977_9STRA|nr:Hypothetical protein PHPALM_8695 [Phytophthora palmivora]